MTNLCRAVLAALPALSASISTLAGIPAAPIGAPSRPLSAVRQLVLPPLDTDRLLAEDLAREALGGSPRRIAAAVEVLTTLTTDGTW